ncbi:hypothetical protein BZG36_02486 [Bifiguratus adelaidae]|uniref:Large ribosomal subunit protein uL30m n=1 Tax=Bifiguratus adelaidae TaxID=1938954 RepID=A0A261Y0Y9_9FUNG|nr:hypothetical protein BZG36_02486 [Bifiguratus adelaidae]
MRTTLRLGQEAGQYFKITQMRSAIGLDQSIRATARSLGIHRLHKPVYHPVNATTAGYILKLKELVHVETVSDIPQRSAEKAARKPERGYTVIGNALKSE